MQMGRLANAEENVSGGSQASGNSANSRQNRFQLLKFLVPKLIGFHLSPSIDLHLLRACLIPFYPQKKVSENETASIAWELPYQKIRLVSGWAVTIHSDCGNLATSPKESRTHRYCVWSGGTNTRTCKNKQRKDSIRWNFGCRLTEQVIFVGLDIYT